MPYLFLSAGKYNQLHRTIGPALGVNMWICFTEHDQYSYDGPPILSNVLKIKEGFKVLEEKKESLQNEYNEIVEQEKGFETITLKNEALLKRIDEIDRIISDSYYQLEKEKC